MNRSTSNSDKACFANVIGIGFLLSAAALFSGCGDNAVTGTDGGPDSSVPADLTIIANNPDFTTTGLADQSMPAFPDLAETDFGELPQPDFSGVTLDFAGSTADLSMMAQGDLATGPEDLMSTDLLPGTLHDFILQPGDAVVHDAGNVDQQMDGPLGVAGDAAACTGAPAAECATCIGQSCNQQITAAFGANWMTSDANSPCAGVYACTCACIAANPQNSSNCVPTCVAKASANCSNLFNTASACVQQKCVNSCK